MDYTKKDKNILNKLIKDIKTTNFKLVSKNKDDNSYYYRYSNNNISIEFECDRYDCETVRVYKDNILLLEYYDSIACNDFTYYYYNNNNNKRNIQDVTGWIHLSNYNNLYNYINYYINR